MNNFVLNEKKKDDEEKEDTKDDGLLNHGLNKKTRRENPYYTDYKNKQIMNGKTVKTYQGWKKEQKWKKRLAALGTVGVAVGTYKFANRNSMGSIEKRNQNRMMKGYKKTSGRQACRYGRALGNMWNPYNESNDIINYLVENYTYDELLNYYNKINNEAMDIRIRSNSKNGKFKTDISSKFSFDKKDWEVYVHRMQAQNRGSEILSYREWLAKKKKIRAKTLRNYIGGAIGTYITANKIQKAVTGKTIPQTIRGNNMIASKENELNKARDVKTTTNMTAQYMSGTYNPRKPRNTPIINRNINRAVSNIDSILRETSYDDIMNYLEALNDKNFRKESYEKYCIMAESRGLIPMDEALFDSVKDKIGDLAATTMDSIKNKKEEMDDKKEEKRRQRVIDNEMKASRKAARIKEKTANMSPEEKREYLRTMRKLEEQDEDDEQSKKDIKNAFIQSVVRGAGERLGDKAVNILTGAIAG